MNDQNKMQAELLIELNALREKVASLESTEKRYRTLVQNLPVGIFQSTLDGRYQLVNSAFAHMLGYDSVEDVIEGVDDISSLYANPKDRDEVLRLFRENGEISGHRIRYKQRNGNIRWMSIFAKCVYDDGGEIKYFDGFALDVTQRKLAEDQLRYKAILLDSISDAVITTDLDFTITGWNLAAEILFGWSKPDAIGKSMTEVLPTRYINTTREAVIAEFTSANSWQGEVIQPHRDGREQHILASVNLVRDENGRPLSILAVNRDISIRRKNEEILRESREQFKALFEQSPIAIELFDAEGLLINANPKCLNLFGVDNLQHVLGFRLFNDPNIPQNEIEQLKQGKQISFASEFDFELVKEQNLYPTSRSGKMFWEVFIKALINNEGVIFGYLVQILDITARKMAEEQYRAFFTENVSPVYWLEMKNPIPTDLPADEQVQAIFQEASFKDVNDRAAKMYGLSRREELIGKSLSTVYNAESLQKGNSVYESFKGYVQNGYLDNNAESTELTQEGKQKWFLNNSRGIVENGRLMRILGSQIDITERKLTEEALKESEARYKSIISALSEGLVVQDKSDKIVMCNKSAANILGLTVNQLMGKDSYDPRWQAFREDGLPFQPEDYPSMITLRTSKPVNNRIMNVHTGDGKRAIISINSRPIVDASNLITGVVATFTDITEQKEAEIRRKRMADQLQEQAHQLQLVVDTVPDGVLVIDSNNRVFLANSTAKNHLALLNQGKHIGDHITQIGDLTLTDLLTPPPQGLWHAIEYMAYKFELLAKPMNTNEGSDGWVIVIRDVTEEWRIEKSIQQQERLASVGQLAAGIAHDFNNILAVITLYADLSLLHGRLQPKNRKHFEIVKIQSLRATELIRQILDFSRRSVMEQVEMDLLPLIKELVKLFERTLPENITTTHKHQSGNYYIKGDPARIQQVFMNLVFNARDAMPEGGEILISLKHIELSKHNPTPHPELASRLLENDLPTEWLCITVKDNGTGMDANVLQHIFEPFYTTKEVGKGSGMGLSQVFGIIKQHDGEIDVKTKPGEGSKFLIYLPALARKTPTLTSSKLTDFPLGNQETILVVEDNPNMQQVVLASLEELNYNTVSARNGEEALDILKEKETNIDLILTDLIMPRMGGKKLLQTIRDAGDSTKIVIMTGHPLHEEKEAILALGVAGWLDKPPSLAEMAQVIVQALTD